MGIFEIFAISLSLAMDAFAVSICKGLSIRKMNWKNAIVTGAYFGSFQAIMPVLGFYLGVQFEALITSVDHWIVFVLLLIIGGNMIKESRSECDNLNDSFDFKTMLPLAVATSIDAMAVGITFACLDVNIIPAALTIGIITFLCGTVGVKIGNAFGLKYKSKAEFAGGVVLILIGTRILLEQLLF